MPIKPRLADPNAAAHERLYRSLRQKVMHGELAPGQPITLRGLAAEYGVSMTPAREAVRRLAAEGALVLKLWFHLSKSEQKKKLRALSEDPLTAWRVTPGEWRRHDRYERYARVAAEALRETSTGEAPLARINTR